MSGAHDETLPAGPDPGPALGPRAFGAPQLGDTIGAYRLEGELITGCFSVCDEDGAPLDEPVIFAFYYVSEIGEDFDHAMALNAGDPFAKELIEGGMAGRVVVFDGEDPTTEVMARRIFEEVTGAIAEGRLLTDAEGNSFGFPTGLVLERVRVTETSSSWAEYGL